MPTERLADWRPLSFLLFAAALFALGLLLLRPAFAHTAA